MPRNKNYDKHARIQVAKRKRYFQSLSRDFNMECLKDTFSMLDYGDKLLESNTHIKALYEELDILLQEPISKMDLVRASNVLMLIWERMEKVGKNGIEY